MNRQDWCRAKVLEVAIQGVREVNVLISWVDSDVVEGVVLPTVKVVCENSGIVRGDWVDFKERWCRLVAHSFASEENVSIVICSAYLKGQWDKISPIVSSI